MSIICDNNMTQISPNIEQNIKNSLVMGQNTQHE